MKETGEVLFNRVRHMDDATEQLKNLLAHPKKAGTSRLPLTADGYIVRRQPNPADRWVPGYDIFWE